MANDDILQVPQGRFCLKRFPLRKNENLRAWDAADEYVLNDLADMQVLTPSHTIAVLNDNYGALAVGLHRYRPYAISDSFLSRKATLANMRRNDIGNDCVHFLESLQTPEAGIDFLVIRIPKTLALMEDQLLRLRPYLKPGCRVIAAAMLKNLPTTAWKLLERLIGPVSTSLAVKKARLIFATLDPSLVSPENPYPVNYLLEGAGYRLWNHANVFSRDGLDIGSRFLLRYLPVKAEYHDVIDLGCGNGVIGLSMAAAMPESRCVFVDESFMAIASARLNFQSVFGEQRLAQFVVDDCLSSFAENSTDCIVCNPPFHQQFTVGDMVARQMFRDARRVLRNGGELRVVGNRHLKYGLILKKIFGNCERVADNAKFTIVAAVK